MDCNGAAQSDLMNSRAEGDGYALLPLSTRVAANQGWNICTISIATKW